jgi:hypothetical protein
MKTRYLVAVLLAVTACFLWWGRGSERDPLQSSDPSIEPSIEPSIDRSADATRRAAAREARAWSRADGPSSADRSGAVEESVDPGSGAPSGSAAGPGHPEPDPAEAAPTPSASATALREHLDASFDQQAADAAWSGSARLEITRKFAALMPPTSTMKSVECRATMCRLEMVYDDLAQYQAFMSRLSPDALPWNGSLFSTPVGDPSVGPVTFVAFLSRDGQQLAVD